MHFKAIAVATSLVVTAHLFQQAAGHMQMVNPPPRQSRGNPGPGNVIDYDLSAPLGTFPCRGASAQAPVLTVSAGDTIPVKIQGGAPHDGGHCQFSLSYDGDNMFVAIDTVFRTCVSSMSYAHAVRLPAQAPAGNATLAWTWINAVGNREYYMNCADIAITNVDRNATTLAGPQMLVANLPQINNITFPEFGGNRPDNRELFEKHKKIITVTGNGRAGPTILPVLGSFNDPNQ